MTTAFDIHMIKSNVCKSAIDIVNCYIDNKAVPVTLLQLVSGELRQNCIIVEKLFKIIHAFNKSYKYNRIFLFESLDGKYFPVLCENKNISAKCCEYFTDIGVGQIVVSVEPSLVKIKSLGNNIPI